MIPPAQNSLCCEITFDAASGHLIVESDYELQAFVDKLLHPGNLWNRPINDFTEVNSVEYRMFTPFSGSSMGTHLSHMTFTTEDRIDPSLSDTDFSSRRASICPTSTYADSSFSYSPCASSPSYDSEELASLPPAGNSASPSDENSLALVPIKSEVKNGDAEAANGCDTAAAAAAAQKMTAMLSDIICTQDKRVKIIKILEGLQQLPCKTLIKELIRKAIPTKKIVYPYKEGENARPPCWPQEVPHHQPDHMSKRHRLLLLHHFLTTMDYETVCEVCVSFRCTLPRRKWPLLDQLLAALK